MSVVIEFADEEFDFLMGVLDRDIKMLEYSEPLGVPLTREGKERLDRLRELYNDLERLSDL